jgi:hypothetical protein
MGVVLSYYADLKQKGECNQWPLYALCYGRFMLYVTALGRICVTDCNRNRSGLQSARFRDHIRCLYHPIQDHIICL